MAIVKLFNLSEKVQVLVRKYYCEEDDLEAISIETIIDHGEAEISGAMRTKYANEETRNDAYENKIDKNTVVSAANAIINMVLGDDEAKQYLIITKKD